MASHETMFLKLVDELLRISEDCGPIDGRNSATIEQSRMEFKDRAGKRIADYLSWRDNDHEQA